MGAGGATAIAGGALLAVALSTKSDLENVRDGEQTWPEFHDSADDVAMQSTIGATLLGVGTAAAMAGLVWELTSSGERGRATVEVGLGRTVVRLQRAF